MNVKNFDELYPGRFLKAGLVTEKPTYTISDVYLDTLEVEKKKADNKGDEPKTEMKKKGIVKFADTEFELTLNKTNGQCLKAMFGSELSAWIGKQVTLCSEKTKFGHETVDAVRVYGSPNILSDVNVTIQLPRRKPVVRTLKRIVTPETELKELLESPIFTDEYIQTINKWVSENPKGIYKAIEKVKAKLAENGQG